MGKRRKRHRRTRTVNAPAATATAQAPAQAPRPWREVVRRLRDRLLAYAETHHAPTLQAAITERFGNPPTPERPDDALRVAEDRICAPGSAGGSRSILRAWVEDAGAAPGPGLEAPDLAQALRWEGERHQGVFVVLTADRDRLVVWDPLEGASLTLYLLQRWPKARVAATAEGALITTTYLPYMARLVAVGLVETWTDPDARALFEAQARESGRTWHEAPPAAPRRSPRA